MRVEKRDKCGEWMCGEKRSDMSVGTRGNVDDGAERGGLEINVGISEELEVP